MVAEPNDIDPTEEPTESLLPVPQPEPQGLLWQPFELPDPPWAKSPKEPARHYADFHAYLLLGPARTMTEIVRIRGVRDPAHWKKRAKRYRWKERVDAWDRHNAEISLKRKEEILSTGFALEHERVLFLKETAEFERFMLTHLQDAIKEQPTNLNNKRMKLIRTWETFQKAAEQTAASIAAETGGRVKKVSVHAELESYAIVVAQELGYDIEKAKNFAKVIEAEGRLLPPGG